MTRWGFKDRMKREVWSSLWPIKPYVVYWNCENYWAVCWPLEHDRDRSVEPISISMSDLQRLDWTRLETNDWREYKAV